jgi:hypothetical protein
MTLLLRFPGILTLPLETMINGSISVAIGVMLQLLSFSIAQCTLDQEKELWRTFFDRSSEGNGGHIFDRLLIVYENRLNTESNDTLKLTVSNMIKALLNLSVTAKRQAVESKVQTKLTLFSLQSDRCVGKVSRTSEPQIARSVFDTLSYFRTMC